MGDVPSRKTSPPTLSCAPPQFAPKQFAFPHQVHFDENYTVQEDPIVEVLGATTRKTTSRQRHQRQLSGSPRISQPRGALARKRHASSLSNPPFESRSKSLESPQPQKRARTQELTIEIASVLNNFTQAHKHEQEAQACDYERQIRKLMDDRDVALEALDKYDDLYRRQADEIKRAQSSTVQMGAQIKTLEANLNASTDRAKAIEAKYQTCKEHLNAAILEQQHLYRQTRIELKKNLALAKQETEEKDTELRLEKERIQTLSGRLKDFQALDTGFESLTTQYEEILAKLDDQGTDATQHSQLQEERIQERYVPIQGKFQSCRVSNMTQSRGQLIDRCVRKARANDCSIMTKLQAILEFQSTLGEQESALLTSLKIHMEQVTERLDRQSENLQQQLEEKAEENGKLSAMLEAEERRYASLESAFETIKKDLETQDIQVTELEDRLFSMDAVQQKNEEMEGRLAVAEKQKDHLEEQLACKAATIKELESSLRRKDETYMSEVRNFTINLVKLNQTIQEKEATLNILVEQAARVARQEMQVETDKAVSHAQNALREAERQVGSLRDEVKRLKQNVDGKAEEVRQTAQTIASFEKRLTLAESEKQAVTDQLEHCISEL
ncbi:hypothetical protein B0T14DRAFT_433894, partial [Immersiella caudata]